MAQRYRHRATAVPIVLLASMTTINGSLTFVWATLGERFVEAAPAAWTALAALWTLQAAAVVTWLRPPRAVSRRVDRVNSFRS